MYAANRNFGAKHKNKAPNQANKQYSFIPNKRKPNTGSSDPCLHHYLTTEENL